MQLKKRKNSSSSTLEMNENWCKGVRFCYSKSQLKSNGILPIPFQGMIQRPGSMQSFHQAFFGEFDPVQFQLTKGGFISLITTVIIKKTYVKSKCFTNK